MTALVIIENVDGIRNNFTVNMHERVTSN